MMANLNLLINTESFLNEVKKISISAFSERNREEEYIPLSELENLIQSMLTKQDSDNTTRPKSYVCTMCDGKKEVLNGDPMNGMEICPTCEGQGHFLCFPRTTRE